MPRKKQPHGSKIVGSSSERDILDMIKTGMPFSEISKSLKEKFGIKISPPTIAEYKRNFYSEDTKGLERQNEAIVQIVQREDYVSSLDYLLGKLEGELARLNELQLKSVSMNTSNIINGIVKTMSDLYKEKHDYTKTSEEIIRVKDLFYEIVLFFKDNLITLIKPEEQQSCMDLIKNKFERIEKEYFSKILGSNKLK